MDFNSFTEKTDLCSKTEIEKIKLTALYLALFEQANEFNLKTSLAMLESVGCSISNISRLKNNLKEDRNFKRNNKTDNWILNAKIIKELQKLYKEQLDDKNTIESNSELLDENKFTGKKTYLDSLIAQANNCFKNNCYDACAVILRRIFEISLILAYRKNNIETEIQDSSGQTLMLEKIVNNAVNNQILKLSKRNLQKEYSAIRNIGNYAAHKIEYNTSFKDIDDIKTILRVRLEELYHKAGLYDKED